MLNDPERKLLRILNNCDVMKKPVPTYLELFHMTGRHEKMITSSLNLLEESGFIKWDGTDTESIVIINGWEEMPAPQVTPNNLPYGRY